MDYDNKFFQYVDFLETKYDLDKKSMSPELWTVLSNICSARSSHDSPWPSRVLDCGSGTGAMLRHLLDQNIRVGEYHGIDIHPKLLSQARTYVTAGRFSHLKMVPEFHALSVYNISRASSAPDARCARAFQKQFDLVCALSLAEHVEIDRMLANIRNVLKDGGILFLPINYAGGTIFEPTDDYMLEETIIDNFNYGSISGQVYEGQVGGDAFCGRTLYHSLVRNGFEVLALCPEDWLIVPDAKPPYYATGIRDFLNLIIDEIAKVNVRNVSGMHTLPHRMPTRPLTDALVNGWQKMRRDQIGQGQLVFRCHQTGAIARKKVSALLIQPLETTSDATT